ncbi:hypothetical protein ACOMHN_008389 [Nucella lapillus]
MVLGLNPSTTDESIYYYFCNTRKSGGGPVEWVRRLDEARALVHFGDSDDAESVKAKPQLKLEGWALTASAPDCDPPGTESVLPPAHIPAVSDLSGTVFAENQNAGLHSTVEPSKKMKNDDGQNPDFQPDTGGTFTRKQALLNVDLSRLKMLSNPKVLEKIGRDFPGVEICVDMEAETAHIKASKKPIQESYVDVQSLLDSVGEVRIPVSPALFKMHEKEREWIWRTVIEDLDLLCHWELLDHSLLLCAPRSKLLLLERVFRSLFVEVRVPLEGWEEVLVDKLQQSFVEVAQRLQGKCPEPVLVLELEGKSVVIVDAPSTICQTQMAVRHFLDSHERNFTALSFGHVKTTCGQTCRTIPNLKAAQLKVLGCPRVLDKWCRDCPDLQISVDQENKRAVVKASPDTLDTVFLYVMQVREVKVPLSAALVLMYEKEESREWVDETLMHCQCHWELCSGHIIITCHDLQLGGLEQTFKDFFTEVTVHFKVKEAALLTKDVWTSFIEEQHRHKGEWPSPVLLREEDRVIIVDVPQHVALTERALRQLLRDQSAKGDPMSEDGEEPSLQRGCSPNQVCEDCILNLRPGQLSILSMARALGPLCKQFPGLTVSTDREERAAVIRAPLKIMPVAFSAVQGYVALLNEARIPLSPALAQMYKTDRNKDWIERSCVDKYDLICHWEVCDGHLVINAASVELCRMERMFKSLFQEVKVCLEEKEAKTVTACVWESFVARQREVREDGLTPVLLYSSDGVTIVDSPSKISVTQLALKQFLNELRHAHLTSPTKEETVSDLEPRQVKVLSFPTAFDKLHKKYPGAQVSVDTDSRTMKVRAPEDVIQDALADTLTLLDDIKEIIIPLSPAVARMFEKEDSKVWIQKTLIEKYEWVCLWELCDQRLMISALCSSQNLLRMERVFSSLFKELLVSLKDWETGTLTSSAFQSFVRDQGRDRKETPTPVLLLGEGSVTIVDTAARAKETQLALIQLLNELGEESFG